MVLVVILGFFLIIVLNLSHLSDYLMGQLQIVVCLKDSMKQEELSTLQRKLLVIKNVSSVVYVPRERGLLLLQRQLGTTISLDDVPRNPLPDTFEVRVDEPQYIEPVARAMFNLPGVTKVKYGADVARRLLALYRVVHFVGLFVLALLFFATVLIISNTIRLTVFARRKEIHIMQLVGAARWFVRWPFVLEGVIQGFFGAFLASVIVNLSYSYVIPGVEKAIPFLPILRPQEIFNLLCLPLLAMGIFVGALGSLISINRFLKV